MNDDPTLQHLLDAIIENPDDDGPRLAYSGRLEELGHVTRAEFIRCQVEFASVNDCLANSGDDDATTLLYKSIVLGSRQAKLLDSPGPDGLHSNGVYWFPCSEVLLKKRTWRETGEYHRGFVERLVVTADEWVGCGDSVCASCPVREVKLLTWPCEVIRQRPGPTRPVRFWMSPWARDGWLWQTREEIQAMCLETLTERWPGIQFTLAKGAKGMT